jgi:N-acetylmuramoyl-L-alanine amidase
MRSGNSGILNHVRRVFPATMLLIFAAATLSLWPQASPPTAQQGPAGPSAAPSTAPTASPLAVVVLDPAHGGSDPGARGPSGVLESEIVLDFARVIRIALEGQGFRVLLTREGNQDPSFDDRSTMINGIGDAIFISLHVSSTGPVGTVRAYSYVFPAAAPSGSTGLTSAAGSQLPPSVSGSRHLGLVEWDLAQKAFVDRSRRLAELAQIQLAQKFQGSPDSPMGVPVRQLRTIAAPAIAIEVSSVAVPDAQKLTQMGQPLAEAVARAVVDFRMSLRSGATGLGAPR